MTMSESTRHGIEIFAIVINVLFGAALLRRFVKLMWEACFFASHCVIIVNLNLLTGLYLLFIHHSYSPEAERDANLTDPMHHHLDGTSAADRLAPATIWAFGVYISMMQHFSIVFICASRVVALTFVVNMHAVVWSKCVFFFTLAITLLFPAGCVASFMADEPSLYFSRTGEYEILWRNQELHAFYQRVSLFIYTVTLALCMIGIVISIVHAIRRRVHLRRDIENHGRGAAPSGNEQNLFDMEIHYANVEYEYYRYRIEMGNTLAVLILLTVHTAHFLLHQEIMYRADTADWILTIVGITLFPSLLLVHWGTLAARQAWRYRDNPLARWCPSLYGRLRHFLRRVFPEREDQIVSVFFSSSSQSVRSIRSMSLG